MSEIERHTLLNRFAKYISFDTRSSETSETFPSTEKQFRLAEYLKAELESLGLVDVTLDENCYVMGTLPANVSEEEAGKLPTIGFISHMDTSPDAPGGPVKWRIEEKYQGGTIVLNKEENITMGPKDFPELSAYIGQDIIVTDGKSLLGADDKAGICSIVTAVEYLQQHKGLKHGKIRVGFTPDEEIGCSADRFDLEKFGADFAYTVDGGAIGGLEFENFNAANGQVEFFGRAVHTGDAKNKMKNALTMAARFQMMLPETEQPETTDGYEGFYHVHNLKGAVDYCKLELLVRDHDMEKFKFRKQYVASVVDELNKLYGHGSVKLNLKDMYYNMRQEIEKAPHIVELAKTAMENVGVRPVIAPIRGGTDGARLSFMGLPCPNLFTGGMNYHGIYEYLPIPSLEKAAATVLEIMLLGAKC